MTVQVREYALLTDDTAQMPGIDMGIITGSTFEWLTGLQQTWNGSSQLLCREGTRFLRLGSYVGFLQSPSGESIEILPKTQFASPVSPESLRHLLRQMLQACAGISPREVGQAPLLRSNQPLHEWIFSEFLRHLQKRVRRGLRFDYHPAEDDDSAFIRGQLDMNRQLRQSPGKGARFHIRYDEFTPQRMENRLLRTALDNVLRYTQDSQNWRVANQLSHQLADILPVTSPVKQMAKWHDSKSLAGYREVKPWCRLILENLNPDFQKGQHQGIALLFAMEQLFEGWVGHKLAPIVAPDFKLTEQVKRYHLLSHRAVSKQKEEPWFLLRPDFLIESGKQTFVLDAKWKLPDARLADSNRKYDIRQADLYQMFAYGQTYLRGRGQMMLIYPRHTFFSLPLPAFRFNSDLTLWAVPFDLEQGMLVEGEWCVDFPCFTSTAAREN